MTNEEAWKELRRRWISVSMFADSDAEREYAQALDVALDALERDRWISVDDRLPEPRKDVIVRIKSLDGKWFGTSVDYQLEDGQWKKSGSTWKISVTHWMPLPEPPKEDDNNV